MKRKRTDEEDALMQQLVEQTVACIEETRKQFHYLTKKQWRLSTSFLNQTNALEDPPLSSYLLSLYTGCEVFRPDTVENDGEPPLPRPSFERVFHAARMMTLLTYKLTREEKERLEDYLQHPEILFFLFEFANTVVRRLNPGHLD